MTFASPAAHVRDVIRRVAVGPRMSKNLSREETRQTMGYVLDQSIDPVQAGIFLVALRMKRETDDENFGVLDALRDAAVQTPVAVDDLLDVSDPFNGVDRHLPLSPFLGAILAACGLPTVIHGCLGVGPKHGVTARDVLLAADVVPPATAEAAARTLTDPACGWVYLDQSVAAPKLDALRPLRELMVKRTCLSTLEKLMRPLCAVGRGHLLTGYVHKDYPEPMLAMAREAGYATALIPRGTEGSVIPPLARGLNAAFLHANAATDVHPLEPADFQIDNATRFIPIPDSDHAADESREAFRTRAAKAAAAVGSAVLDGVPGDAADLLTFTAAAALSHARNLPKTDALAQVRTAIVSGDAKARLRST